MRIIHDVETEMLPCGSLSPYRNIRGMRGFHGARAEFLFVGEDSDEVIRIEGNAEHIRHMFEAAISLIDSHKKYYLNKMGTQRPTDCPNCSFDIDYPNATHTEECPFSKRFEKQIESEREYWGKGD